MIKKWKLLLCTVFFAFCSVTANAQMAAFDNTSNVLTLKLLKFGNDYYTGTKVHLAPNGSWTLQTIGTPTSAMKNSEPAVYNASDSTVKLPYILVSGSLFNNLVLSLPLDGRPWAVNDAGNVTTAASPGEVSYPIVSTVPNSLWRQSLLTLANGQTWRVEFGSCAPTATPPVECSCFPASAQAATSESSNVQIYPSASAGEFYMDVTYGTGFKSCTAFPVSGFPVNPSGATLSVMPNAEIRAMVAETRDLYVTGGTTPYFATVDNPSIVSFAFQPRSAGEPGQTLRLYMKSVGSASLSVYDYLAGAPISVAITVEDNPSIGPPRFAVFPSSIKFENLSTAKQFSGMLTGGVPPFKVFYNIWPDNLKIMPFDANKTPTEFNAIAYRSASSGSGTLTGVIMFQDAIGQIAEMQYEISGSDSGILQ